MAARKSLALLFIALYATLSAVCVVSPSALPGESITSAMLVGPPLLLVWGESAWILYSVLSLTIAGLVGVILLGKSPEAKVMAGFVVVAIWLGSGFFATALSV
jgi:hypothetical protein